MKTVLSLIILLAFYAIAPGNIITPKVNISELYIDPEGSWTLELLFPDRLEVIPFDSIEIETMAGKTKVISYTLIDITEPGWAPSYIAVIDNSNLESILEMNRLNDFVKVYSYIVGQPSFDIVSFGNYPVSRFLDFNENYSIARTADGEFSLDNTPTIGEKNTEEGMTGTVQGYLFDNNHYPLRNTDLVVFGPDVVTNEIGFYSEYVLSRTYFIDDTVMVWLNPTQTYIFEPDTINVLPDSLISTDIVLLSYSINSAIINNPQRADLRFTNFPNPFRDITTFYIYIPTTSYSSAQLQILNNIGQLVVSVPLPQHNENIALTSDVLGRLSAGTYYYTVIADDKPTGLVNTMVKLP